MDDITVPKVFISYSWSTPQHEDWVLNLAERLVSDGVDVTLDKWHLKEGHDKYAFMESNVRSDGINKVLIILDKKYTEKANFRTGGVGTETQIISPNIYSDVSQEKFIPVVAEVDEEGKPFLPTFIESRIYIDLSGKSNFEDEYEKLLRNIYQRPANKKPKLGKPPSYLFNETVITFSTSNIIRRFDNLDLISENQIYMFLNEFLEKFLDDLKEFSLVNVDRTSSLTFGKALVDNLHSYLPLLTDYVIFTSKILKTHISFDYQIFINFFEKMYHLRFPSEILGGYYPHDYDNFIFITHELFLYTVALAVKYENMDFLEELFHSPYLLKRRNTNKSEPKRYSELYTYVDTFDAYYKETYSKNFYSPMADLISNRVTGGITLKELVEADLLIFYVSSLEDIYWFPITYIYRESYLGNIDFFQRLISKRYFEKVKGLLNVDSIEEFEQKLNTIKDRSSQNRDIGYSGSFEYVMPIYEIFENKDIGSMR
ncbi:hypothetical protein A9299_11530 [Moraxella osloensis]|uniref:SEFIR domain-containing protein n=1 Tax=Faucicola osloensis TaxID=34062 RepID=A0AA91FGH8_FAUOS|nr:toll/interleukin-1 receptor domain-containing protein [Moraxella osloensis]OBX61706.1 hypothetical protein A9299_11530 [Moraxella osloensis]